MPTKNMDLPKLVEQFACEDKCREYLEYLRWPEGVCCIRCGCTVGISFISTRNIYECESCGYQFSVKAGTVLHDSKLPLWKWFLAVFLMSQSKKGISANQLKRMLGVSYKTAWHLCHRIRSAMGALVETPLSGIVEVDETYIGGSRKGRSPKNRGGRGGWGHRSMVVGAVQRDGGIRLKMRKNANRKTLHKFIKDHVSDDAEAIYTDSWAPYRGVADHNTRHETVNHNKNEWVRGDVHTNTVENVWSLFKRSIVGSYHHLSAKHLPAYLDEMEWRFNNRDNPYLFRDTILSLVKSDSLPYQELIGQNAA